MTTRGRTLSDLTLKRTIASRLKAPFVSHYRTMKPIYRDKVDVIGVLVGVVRKYR